MRDEMDVLWLETGEGTAGEMALTVRPVSLRKGGQEQQGCGRESMAGGQETGMRGHVWPAGAVVVLKLTGEDGYCLKDEIVWEDGAAEAVFSCPGVKLWDPEHPRLYRAAVSVKYGEEELAAREAAVGFRVLERKGRQLLWNHRALKLKGVCYRERKDDWEGTKRDLEMFRDGNINFLRSVFGPFSSRMLRLCDEMGFLTENTAPFFEVGQARAAKQDLPHCVEEFLEPVREMLKDGCHVGILIWSLGHDCAWGANFRAAAELVRGADPVRPLTFHLPMSIPEEDEKIDVWPVHYIDWKQDFDVCFDQMVIFHTPGEENEIGYMTARAYDYEVPVLHEVWSPVACHNRDEILHDPGIRKFWGESIRRFAEKSYRTQGCLGGAVLAGVDEDGSFEGMGQYGWGILNGNHEPKPEYFSLQEAYAPVEVRLCRTEDGRLEAEVWNRFLFTDLEECRLTVDGRKADGVVLRGQPGSVTRYDMGKEPAAGQAFAIVVESGDGSRKYAKAGWTPDNDIKIITGQGLSRAIAHEGRKPAGEQEDSLHIEWSEGGTHLVVGNSVYEFVFSGKTCLLERASAAGKLIMAGGPYLNCTGLLTGSWTGKKLDAQPARDCVQVTIEGKFGTNTVPNIELMSAKADKGYIYENVLDIRFELLIGKDGTFDTSYEVLKLYRHMPHTVKAEIGMCPGGLNEKGAAYLLADGAENFVWTGPGGCRGKWPCEEGLPGDREHGSISLSSEEALRASRHHITDARVTDSQGRGVAVLSEWGRDSVRLEKAPQLTPEAVVDDRDPRMRFEGSWHRMDDYCGNYGGTETLSRNAGDTMKLAFSGTGVRLYGALDINYGMCDIYLDGQPAAEDVSQYLDQVDFPGVSRGYEKRYGLLLFEAHDLPEAEHELVVRVKGQARPGAQNTYTSIDYAVIEGSSYPVGIRLNVNQDYNYTRLVRGCYKRPKVELIPGVRESFRMKLLSGQE